MKTDSDQPTTTESFPRPLEAGLLSGSALHAQLESENLRLQRLVAELLVRNQQLREALESANRKDTRYQAAGHDSPQAAATYRTENFSTRVVLEQGRP